MVQHQRLVGDVLVLKDTRDAGEVVKELETLRREGCADSERREAAPENARDREEQRHVALSLPVDEEVAAGGTAHELGVA